MLLLPFDSHNHVHMGPTWPLLSSSSDDRVGNTKKSLDESVPPRSQIEYEYYPEQVGGANLLGDDEEAGCLCGMAVMSTHPRDFSRVLELASASPLGRIVIPCIGVHPWFLHELVEEDWQPGASSSSSWSSSSSSSSPEGSDISPRWIVQMEELLKEYPKMPVGEIGLDGFHFDPHTKELTSSMEAQVHALELQLDLAIRYQRPVSIHCVRAMGPTMNVISKVQKNHSGKLPPYIYFHAFGGKAGTATQLIKTFEKKKATRVLFGFAPVINFDSPKTLQVVQEVGLDRLVLETDHEDAALVPPSMKLGVEVIAKVFEVTREELIRQTNENAYQLYNIKSSQVIG